ncbi:hypothetical protein RRG48_04280 [Mycoplasmopsis canis]|nr:hypothetical protein [Mycoplasmopsis cynos]WQQ12928.1 hypothetical protein RRG58_03055 [Mycoplasmopsis cynos]WQQ13291.1 hypothetical protein RRG58_00880 [Mycoplasmopsis cynos]
MNNEEELIFFDEMESNNPSETKNETKPETKENTTNHKAKFVFIGIVKSILKGKYLDKFKETYNNFYIVHIKVNKMFYTITCFDSNLFNTLEQAQDKEIEIIGEIQYKKSSKTKIYEIRFIGTSLTILK